MWSCPSPAETPVRTQKQSFCSSSTRFQQHMREFECLENETRLYEQLHQEPGFVLAPPLSVMRETVQVHRGRSTKIPRSSRDALVQDEIYHLPLCFDYSASFPAGSRSPKPRAIAILARTKGQVVSVTVQSAAVQLLSTTQVDHPPTAWAHE